MRVLLGRVGLELLCSTLPRYQRGGWEAVAPGDYQTALDRELLAAMGVEPPLGLGDPGFVPKATRVGDGLLGLKWQCRYDLPGFGELT